MLPPDERAAQLRIARDAAASVGRDPAALEYTRTASIELTAEGSAALAAQGITRVVVSCPATDPAEQRTEMRAFAERHGLRR